MSRSCTTIDLSAFDATRDAVAADPSIGRGAFTTVTSWDDGARARTTARSFAIETDEPAPLGGTDQAVDPMELLLASIGTCLTIGWVTQAARRGVDFRELRIDVSGDYDLRGYLALDEDVRPASRASATPSTSTRTPPPGRSRRSAWRRSAPARCSTTPATPPRSRARRRWPEPGRSSGNPAPPRKRSAPPSETPWPWRCTRSRGCGAVPSSDAARTPTR